MNPVPDKYKTLGLLQLVAGAVNVFMGWGLAMTMWSLFGTTFSLLCTMGLCPTYLCGFVAVLILPVGIVEVIVGLMTMNQPESVRGVYKFLPYLQLPMILLGDIVSPIVGIVSLMNLRDPDVKAYIEGL